MLSLSANFIEHLPQHHATRNCHIQGVFGAHLGNFECHIAHIHNLLCNTLHLIAKHKGISYTPLGSFSITDSAICSTATIL